MYFGPLPLSKTTSCEDRPKSPPPEVSYWTRLISTQHTRTARCPGTTTGFSRVLGGHGPQFFHPHEGPSDTKQFLQYFVTNKNKNTLPFRRRRRRMRVFCQHIITEKMSQGYPNHATPLFLPPLPIFPKRSTVRSRTYTIPTSYESCIPFHEKNQETRPRSLIKESRVTSGHTTFFEEKNNHSNKVVNISDPRPHQSKTVVGLP